MTERCFDRCPCASCKAVTMREFVDLMIDAGLLDAIADFHDIADYNAHVVAGRWQSLADRIAPYGRQQDPG